MPTLAYVILGAAILLMGAWLIHSKRRNRTHPPGREMAVKGLGILKWDDGITKDEVATMALEMKTILDDLWPKITAIYGIEPPVGWHVDMIYLKNAPIRLNGVDHPVKLWPAHKVLHLDIHGGRGHSWRFWFAGEVHNYYRFLVFGMDRIYPEDPHNPAYVEAQEAWQKWE